MRNSSRLRRIARIGTVLYGLGAALMVSAGPALASFHTDDGEPHGPSLGVGLTILYFVVIPIGAFLIIAGLSVLPSGLSRPRYRPGKEWDHDPQWLGGPEEGAAADSEATARGGASAEW